MIDTKEAEIQILLNLVKDKTGYTLDDLRGPSRKRDIVHVRRAFSAISRKLLALTFKNISEILNKDHATIIHNLNKHNAEIDIYSDYTAVYKNLYKHLELLFIARTEYNSDYMLAQINLLEVQRGLIDKRIQEYKDKIEKLNAGEG